jgi:hypothetical protein
MPATAANPRLLAVFDIDGVVADMRHRLTFLDATPPDWPAFFEAAGQDTPLAEGLALTSALAADHDIIWLTGRPERLRATTARWLGENGFPAGELRMRPDRDRQPARVFKRTELGRLGPDRVAVVVDDDPAVVMALRADGFTVRQADWLPYRAAMSQAQEHHGRT